MCFGISQTGEDCENGKRILLHLSSSNTTFAKKIIVVVARDHALRIDTICSRNVHNAVCLTTI